MKQVDKKKEKLQGYKESNFGNNELDISIMLYGIEDIPEDLRLMKSTRWDSDWCNKYAAGTRDRSIRIIASVDSEGS